MSHKSRLKTKSFAINNEIIVKYKIIEGLGKFSKSHVPNRGANKESLSSAKNIFRRAIFDYISADDYVMRDAFRVGIIMFNGCCYICDIKLYNDDGSLCSNSTVESDHVVSPLHGGSGCAGNMLPICKTCNKNKDDKDFRIVLKNQPEKIAIINDYQKLYYFIPFDENELNDINMRINLGFKFAETIIVKKTPIKTILEIIQNIQ